MLIFQIGYDHQGIFGHGRNRRIQNQVAVIGQPVSKK